MAPWRTNEASTHSHFNFLNNLIDCMDAIWLYNTQMQTLPQEIQTLLSGDERVDFTVQATRSNTLGSTIFLFIFSSIWLGFSVFAMSVVLLPFLIEKTFDTITDGLGTVILPILFISIFVFIGLMMFIGSLRSFFGKGPLFVGTQRRLFQYKKKEVSIFDWEQFTGTFDVTGTEGKGNLSLEMRSGEMVHGKRGSRYQAAFILMIGITGAYTIAKKCQERIK